MDHPLVTVLIDTYNYGHFLGRAIESAMAQTYPSARIEILVVDDGSTDNTADVAQQYAHRIRYIRKARGGQASAINEGFQQARGEIICLLDADDYFYPDKVELVVAAFGSGPEVGLVADRFDIIDEAGETARESRWERTWTGCVVTVSKVPSQIQSLILLGHPWSSVTSAMSVRKSAVEGLEMPEDVFVHSPDLFLSIVLPFVAEVRVIESALTAYVFHGQNVGLYRSSPVNREMYRRQVTYIRHYVEERFGKRFVTYLGRSVYGPEADLRPNGGADAEWQGASRLATYIADCTQIASANVEGRIKLESQLRLAASLLLPLKLYDGARRVRAAQSRLLGRSLKPAGRSLKPAGRRYR